MTQVMMGNEVIAAQYLQAGISLFRRNQFVEAVACFNAVLQIDPDNRYARYNRATALLSSGFYAQGFQEYEATWRLFHWRGFGPVKEDIDRLQALPLWKGEEGVRLLVYHEMGHGDAIMAFRWLKDLDNRAADLTLVIDPALRRLAEDFNITVTDKVPDDLGRFDFRLPLFGVMAALGETEATIPSEPYIQAKFSTETLLGTIGIAWSGRTQIEFSANYFLQLLAHQGHKLYALQPGDAPENVESLPPGSDFADVADRIALMHHIVSVDTAAIHLAGAMGHPSAHLLLPFMSDWRWHHVERWYPTLKTYRQDNRIDWTAPFARINEALQK
jgi:tetratricopeptide (TPR) repeat protein